MKKFLVYVLFLIFSLFIGVPAFCANYPVKTVAVITDTGHRNGTNYLICGAASDIIATDIINRLNMTGRMRAPLLGDTMSKITQQNIPVYYMTFLNEYKYNYNVDFVNLKRVTRNIPADYIVLVTSGLDVQSNFLKDTWWNKLNIPGMDPVKPTYKLTTLITLINKKNYAIEWQDLYLRDIEARNYDIGAVHFSPSYAQLAKIKKYSKNMSEYVANIIDEKVNPWTVPPEEPKSVEMKSKFVNEGTKVYYPAVNGDVVKQNFNEFKNNTKTKIENKRLEREQKKHIENVRQLEKQQEQQKLHQLQLIEQKKEQEKLQTQQWTQIQSRQKKNRRQANQKLFETIKDNIDDVSNTLPPPRKTQEYYIKPAVDVNTNNNTSGIKLMTPVMYKPAAEQQQTQTKQLPSYNWNLKNINEQE